MTHDEKKVVSNDFNRLECGYQVGIIVKLRMIEYNNYWIMLSE